MMGHYPMFENALEVLEEVVDAWSGSFHGVPEELADALDYLADARDAFMAGDGFGPAVQIFDMIRETYPMSEWGDKAKELWWDAVKDMVPKVYRYDRITDGSELGTASEEWRQ